MLTVGSGSSLAWSGDPLVTVGEVDAYATARGWSDWAALTPERKLAATLDASTYVKVTYRAPDRYTAAQEALIKDAASEAARLSLTEPLIGAVEQPQVLRERLDKLETEYAEVKPGAARQSRLALVSALLRSAGLSGGSLINFPLRKA